MKATLPTRRLIPKWRQVKRALATHEAAAPLKSAGSGADTRPTALIEPDSNRGLDLGEFERAVALWNEFKEPGMLGDILSFSLHPELQGRIIDIGNRAIAAGAGVTQAQHSIIQHLAHSNGEHQDLVLPEPGDHRKDQVQPFVKPIRSLRELLRTEPRNALALLDFAQLQAAIGRNVVAERSLRSALGLAPNNRLVLRTLARFYVHAGDPERAHSLVRRHERTPSDPWLVSSEIALADAAGKPSTYLAKGRRMLVEAGKSPSAHFTELAGNMAMVELGAGNLKKAREFQRIALLDPTDNVAAQAIDREQQFGISLSSPNVERAIAASAEAKVLQSWLRLDPGEVEKHALQWHSEEPFSSRPVQMLTALFAYRGDNKRALNWLNVGLRSDGEDRGLLLNLAYVQARLGHSDAARLTILKARRIWGADVEPYLLATEGAIAYQLGRFDEGDRLYALAQDIFDSPAMQRHHISTQCLLNQSIIALECRHPRVEHLIARTNEALQKKPSIEAVMLLKAAASAHEITPDVSSVLPQQDTSRQRLTSQWVFDSRNNILTERKGLTAPGAKSILLLENTDRKS